MSRNEMIKLTLVYHRDSGTAWAVTKTEDDTEEFIWLPKSECEIDETANHPKDFEIKTFLVPEWLAQKKGLI